MNRIFPSRAEWQLVIRYSIALLVVAFVVLNGLVILTGLSQLPVRFGLPAGWGDVAIGLAAPVVALALARGARHARTLGIGWNVLGLLDLVVAVGMGTGLLPLLTGERLPAAAAMGVYPLILVPTFAVPVAVLLHLIALRRLRRSPRPVAGAARDLALT